MRPGVAAGESKHPEAFGERIVLVAGVACARPCVCAVAASTMRLAGLRGHHAAPPRRTPSTALVASFIQVCWRDGFSAQISSFRKTVSVLFLAAINIS